MKHRLFSSRSFEPIYNEWKSKILMNPITERDVVNPSLIQLFNMTLEPHYSSSTLPNDGDPIDPGRSFVLFPSRVSEQMLASDGYDNSWNPPAPFSKRMWVGGKMSFYRKNGL